MIAVIHLSLQLFLFDVMARKKTSKNKRPRKQRHPVPEERSIGNSAAAPDPHRRFVWWFGLLCLVVFVLIHLTPESNWLWLNEATAHALSFSLGWIGFQAHVRQDLVFGGGFSVRIISECTILLLGSLYSCFVLTFPATLKGRLLGLLSGLVFLFLANQLRLLIVFGVGIYDRTLFNLVHVYLGQIAMVFTTLATCLLWMRGSGVPGPSMPSGRFWGRLALWSIPLCALWIWANREYVGLLDAGVEWLFSLWDYRFVLKRDHSLYYQTFNLVTIIAVVLASTRIPRTQKTKALACGLGLAALFHFLFRVFNLCLAAFGMAKLYPLSVLITTLGQYLLPVLIYFGFSRSPSPKAHP